MLGIKNRLFGSSEETLAEHYNITVLKDGDTVKFNPKPHSDRCANLILDNENYTISNNMTFSIGYLKEENAVLENAGDLLYSFATETVDESICIIVGEKQVADINNITVNRQGSVFDSDTHYKFDVFKSSEEWLIEVSGFYKNNPIRLGIEMNGSYPDFDIRNIKTDDADINISEVKEREVVFECYMDIKGDVRFGMKKLELDCNTAYNLGDDKTIFGEIDEIESKIEQWNCTDYEFQIRPDSYTPFKKEVSEVIDDKVMVVNINENDDLTELGSIKIEYPEWVVNIDPRLSYEKTDASNKYSNRKIVEDNVIVFDKVIPNEEIKVYHGGGVGRFENNILNISGIQPKESKFVRLSLTPKRKGLFLRSKREDTVNFIINSESFQLSEREYTEVDTDSVLDIKVKSLENELIDELEMSKEDFLTIKEITVIDDKLSVS